MFNRIFQNLTGFSRYAHPGSENIGYLSAGSGNGALDSLLHRLRAWLAGIDRKRAIEHENAQAIAHLQSSAGFPARVPLFNAAGTRSPATGRCSRQSSSSAESRR